MMSYPPSMQYAGSGYPINNGYPSYGSPPAMMPTTGISPLPAIPVNAGNMMVSPSPAAPIPSMSPSVTPYQHPTTVEQIQLLLTPLRYTDKTRVARDINGLLRQTNSLQCKVGQLGKVHAFVHEIFTCISAIWPFIFFFRFFFQLLLNSTDSLHSFILLMFLCIIVL